MSDTRQKAVHRHSECGRMALFDAANDLRLLMADGVVLPNPLRLQVQALIAALVAEADA